MGAVWRDCDEAPPLSKDEAHRQLEIVAARNHIAFERLVEMVRSGEARWRFGSEEYYYALFALKALERACWPPTT